MKLSVFAALTALLVSGCERKERSPQPDIGQFLDAIDVHVATIPLKEERQVRVVVEFDGRETEDFASARFDRDFMIAVKPIEGANKIRIALGDGGDTISGVVDGDPFSGQNFRFNRRPEIDQSGRCTVIEARSKDGKRSRVLVIVTPVAS